MRQAGLGTICRTAVWAVLMWLSACSAPVKNWDPTGYTVQSGDTLYSIAWRYEIDPDDLVRWNKLTSPSLIHPGQRLRMQPPRNTVPTQAVEQEDPEAEIITEVVPVSPKAPARAEQDSAARVVVRKNDTLYAIARRHGVPVAQLIRVNRLKKPYRIYAGQALRLYPASQQSQADTAAGKLTKPHKTIKTVTRKTRLTWRWPLQGKVVKRFNKRRLDARGIDIRSRAGEPVKAAASGKVVYSGNGLIGYGNLVIIKHNNTYLSAYANNHTLLVREGEAVKQGQVIARLDKSASTKPVLHFEIRKKGKPVDPLRYLPSS